MPKVLLYLIITFKIYLCCIESNKKQKKKKKLDINLYTHMVRYDEGVEQKINWIELKDWLILKKKRHNSWGK